MGKSNDNVFSRPLVAAKVLLNGNLLKLYKLTIANMAVGILDLIGVLLLGLIGGMAVLGVQSKSLNSSFNNLANLVDNYDNYNNDEQKIYSLKYMEIHEKYFCEHALV